jgi:hypothetical protein
MQRASYQGHMLVISLNLLFAPHYELYERVAMECYRTG